jgi:hypothetical protein
MIEQGTFAAKGVSLKWSKSPEKGTECVVVLCRLLEGPNKDATIDWVGWISEKTVARTQEALTLFGYDGQDDSTISRNTVQVVVEHETFVRANGEEGKRARIAWVNNPSGAGRFDSMSTAEISGAKERLKAAGMSLKNKATQQVNPEDEPRF